MTNTAVGISGFGGYVPEHVMTNEDWTRYVDTSDEWIVERTGIHRRRVAAEDESTADMATAAARSALESRGIGPEEIDEIIVATDTPEVYTPDTASFVQRKLGARQVPSYDLGGSGCAGFVQAMDVARSRVLTGTRRVLVIGVELITRLVSWKIRETCVLFGDAAAGVIVERGPQMAEILGAKTGTDGSQWSILTLEIGGTRKPFSLEYAQKEEHLKLIMEGRAVFRHAVHRMSEVGLDVLEAVGAKLEDVAMIVPHQANLRIVQAVAKNLSVPMEKVYTNLQEYGNTGSASVPLALWEAHSKGRISPGDLVLLTSFGAGFHWGAALLRFTG
ncbi:MAG: ketoacyl-ACP synthase III [Acidobacteriota bacterium]|nr:ketoacyl-ACP synthase III [Acidobacteriota bacterium]